MSIGPKSKRVCNTECRTLSADKITGVPFYQSENENEFKEKLLETIGTKSKN